MPAPAAILRVEVRADEGEWQPAQLREPLSGYGLGGLARRVSVARRPAPFAVRAFDAVSQGGPFRAAEAGLKAPPYTAAVSCIIRRMKRIILLATLVTVGALSLGVAAFQQPPARNAPKVVEVEKLSDNLFMLKGGGGNTAVFVRSDGIIVVDTKNPGWGQPILDKIKKLSTKPITTIINTHTHGDHVSGNVEFPATVEVIVQENTKANMQEMRGATGIAQNGPPPNIFKAEQRPRHAEARRSRTR